MSTTEADSSSVIAHRHEPLVRRLEEKVATILSRTDLFAQHHSGETTHTLAEDPMLARFAGAPFSRSCVHALTNSY